MTTWKALFDRAGAHEVSLAAIREELERRRSTDDGSARRAVDGDARGDDDG